MKQIRKGVFETNSSSSHSITISDKGGWEEIKSNVIEIESGEYGWEFDTFTGFYSKASYIYTYLINSGDKDEIEWLRKIVKEYTNADKVIFEHEESEEEPRWGYGYIDHQSSDVPQEALVSEETLKAFLFNKHSFFETGNDNV